MIPESAPLIPQLPQAESLKVEFKSDRKRLSDDELAQALVCLANTEGGELWLGVEDDGTPTGLHEAHRNLVGLAGLVAARTSPSLDVTVVPLEIAGVRVARITVAKSASSDVSSDVATTAAVYLRRRIKQDGTPECTPMLPHERNSRANRLGLNDASAQTVAGATLADFDPLERERLRQAVHEQKRLSADELAHNIHSDPTWARRTLEQLVEVGLVQHGVRRWAYYTPGENVAV